MPKHGQILYLRAFLRSSDYFALTLRLLALSLLALIFISNRLVAVGLALVFNYLLLFQLLTLSQHFDYQYLTNLYPISEKQKAANLKNIFEKIIVFIGLFGVVINVFLASSRLIDFGNGYYYRMVSSLQNQ